MALSVEYIVHSVNVVPTTVAVEHEGDTLRAAVDCCEVELASENGRHGSVTLRFTGKDCTEARARFKAGQSLTWAV